MYVKILNYIPPEDEFRYLSGFVLLLLTSPFKPQDKNLALFTNIIVNLIINVVVHGIHQTLVYICIFLLNFILFYFLVRFKYIENDNAKKFRETQNKTEKKKSINTNNLCIKTYLFPTFYLIFNLIAQILFQYYLENKISNSPLTSISYKFFLQTIIFSWLCIQYNSHTCTFYDVANYALMPGVTISGPYPQFNAFVSRNKNLLSKKFTYKLKRYLQSAVFMLLFCAIKQNVNDEIIKSQKNIFIVQFLAFLNIFATKCCFYFAWTFSSTLLLEEGIEYENIRVKCVESARHPHDISRNWNIFFHEYFKKFIYVPGIYLTNKKWLSFLLVYIISGCIHSLRSFDMLFFLVLGLSSLILPYFLLNSFIDIITMNLYITLVGSLKIYRNVSFSMDFIIKKIIFIFLAWLAICWFIKYFVNNSDECTVACSD